MRGFFAWASDKTQGNLVTLNPTTGVKLLVGKNDANGFHTWSQEELDRAGAKAKRRKKSGA